jgi:hypothetical protein
VKLLIHYLPWRTVSINLNMHELNVARRAQKLGVRSVPAIVIDGALADCCAGRDVDEATLRVAGLGQPL